MRILRPVEVTIGVKIVEGYLKVRGPGKLRSREKPGSPSGQKIDQV